MKRGRKPGYKRRKKTRKKISRSLIGRKRSKAECEAISHGHKARLFKLNRFYNELVSEYGDNAEAKAWLDKHKNELKEGFEFDASPDYPIMTDKELSNSGLKFRTCDFELMEDGNGMDEDAMNMMIDLMNK